MDTPPVAEAVLTEDGKVKQVGSVKEIMARRDRDAALVNLEGKTMLPAFTDCHSHIVAFAQTLRFVDLSGAESFADMQELIREFIQKKGVVRGEWVIGFGYDHNFFKEKAHPDKFILDQISGSHPVMLSHRSGHMGVLNSMGLERLGVTEQSEDPQGGVIGRRENSREPNGYLEEKAFMAVTGNIPEPGMEMRKKLLEQAQEIYLSYGITTAQEGMMNQPEFGLLSEMAEEGRLKFDVVGYIDLNKSPELEEHKRFLKKYRGRFKIGGYKIFLDGSPQGRTAWMTRPYEGGEEGYCGYPVYQDGRVRDFIKAAADGEMQLLTHCNGDAAADQLLRCYRAAEIKQDLRPVMIHAQLARKDQIREMKRLRMIPSYFVEHVYQWGDTHIENFGMERARHISPLASALEEGWMFTLHQDTPVLKPDMLHTVWCAVNRRTKEGTLLGEEERVTPYEALKAVTVNGAYQYFEEKTKGSIREGKRADFVILDKNPLQTPPEELKEIRVLQTIREGQVLYRKEERADNHAAAGTMFGDLS